jgi:hypothetical protein
MRAARPTNLIILILTYVVLTVWIIYLRDGRGLLYVSEMLCGRNAVCVDDQTLKTPHNSVATTLANRATFHEQQDDETGRAKVAGSSEAAELLDVAICPGLKATG